MEDPLASRPGGRGSNPSLVEWVPLTLSSRRPLVELKATGHSRSGHEAATPRIGASASSRQNDSGRGHRRLPLSRSRVTNACIYGSSHSKGNGPGAIRPDRPISVGVPSVAARLRCSQVEQVSAGLSFFTRPRRASGQLRVSQAVKDGPLRNDLGRIVVPLLWRPREKVFGLDCARIRNWDRRRRDPPNSLTQRLSSRKSSQGACQQTGLAANTSLAPHRPEATRDGL